MKTTRCYFTVATCNYLAYVRALATQLRVHEPEARFFALLVDKPVQAEAVSGLPFDVHFAEDVVDPLWFQRATYFYSAFELANNLKPVGHRLAQNHYGAKEWAYLDSDIYVLGRLDPLWSVDHDIVLTPHRLTAELGLPRREEELFFLRFGSANGGVLACRHSQAAAHFTQWFEQALQYGGFNEWRDGYVDQKWLDLVPGLFSSAGFCRHPGINVGHWNLGERPITRDSEGNYSTAGLPLLAFHFSKWSPERWEAPPSGQAHIPEGTWLALSRAYRDLLMTEGWTDYRQIPYRYDLHLSGESISREMRRAYFERRAAAGNPWTQARWRHRLAATGFILRRLGQEIGLAGAGLLRLLSLRR